MEEFKCPLCGANKLEKRADGTYFCLHCGGILRDEFAEEQKAIIRTLFGEEIAKAKEEQIASVRRNLWRSAHEKYIDSEKIVTFARDLKNLLPDDFQANFYEVANSGNTKDICRFINEINVEQSAIYLPDVLNFLIKSLEPALISPVKDLITRAFKDKQYTEYISKVEDEAFKLDEGVYTSSLPRDVFLAYSSADMGSVNEICELLESQGFTCFVALRNLRHGRGAVQNYQNELQTAMRNCKCAVFLSSENSRSFSCDALKIEIPYMKDYCPNIGRVEYILEDYGKKTTQAAKIMLKGFFKDLEWCRTEDDLIARVVEAVTKTETPEKKQSEYADIVRAQQEKIKQLEAMMQNNAAIVAEQRMRETALSIQQKAQEAERKAKEEAQLKERERMQSQNKAREEAERKAKEEAERPFTIKNNVLKKYNGTGGDVKIPDGVTEIEAEAFRDCRGLTSIEIPDGVTKIGESAFDGCSGLTSIKIPDSVTEIGKSAFRDCRGLTSIKISNSVTKIGRGAFYCCMGLTSIKIPDGVTIIEEDAFSNCSGLTSIEIPDGVTIIGGFAFFNCRGLTSIEIPDGVENIGGHAFYGCSGLTSIKIPDGVTKIGRYAFYGCRALTIYCNVKRKPMWWASDWAEGAKKVRWKPLFGYK